MFCARQLVRLRDRRAEIERAGGALAAISVDAPEVSAKLASELAADGGPLGFPLLSDPSRAAVKAFGVHDAEHDIALPAVLILGERGEVAWKHVGDGILDRPEEDAIIGALAALTRGGKPAPPP